MKFFKDANNREWMIKIDNNAIKRIEAITGIEHFIPKLEDPNFFEMFIGDPVMICDTIYAICKPQAEKQNINDEQFGEILVGEPIEHALYAFMEALVEYFPPKKARVHAEKWRRACQIVETGLEKQYQALVSPDLEDQINQALSGGASTKSQDILG